MKFIPQPKVVRTKCKPLFHTDDHRSVHSLPIRNFAATIPVFFLPFPSNHEDKGSHPYRAVSSNHLRVRCSFFFPKHHHHHHHHHESPVHMWKKGGTSSSLFPLFSLLFRRTTLVITVIKQCCNRYNKGYSTLLLSLPLVLLSLLTRIQGETYHPGPSERESIVVMLYVFDTMILSEVKERLNVENDYQSHTRGNLSCAEWK